MKRKHLRLVSDAEAELTEDYPATITVLQSLVDKVEPTIVAFNDDGMVLEIDTMRPEAVALFEAMRTVKNRKSGAMTLNQMQRALGIEGLADSYLDWEVSLRGQ